MKKAQLNNQEILNQVIIVANLGLWDWNIQTGEIINNRQFVEMLGYSVEEIEPNIYTWEKLLHPDDKPSVIKVLNEHLKGKLLNFEIGYRLRAKSGEWKWILDSGKVIERNTDGKPLRAIGIRKDITYHKLIEENIRKLAYHDPLTGLPNRILFNDHFTLELDHAHRNQDKLAIMLFDLDHFKIVNDTLGHSTGDKLLQAIGDRLLSILRKSDTVARLGGDEFVLLLPEIDMEGAEIKIAEKILKAFQKPFSFNGQELNVTLSIGIAIFPDNGLTIDALMKNADIAMYRVKKNNRNNYQLYTP